MKLLMTSVLEKTINRFIELDPETLQRLSPYRGYVFKIMLPDWKFCLYFHIQERGLQLSNYYDGSVNTTISSSFTALLKQTMSNQPQVNKEIKIEGDIEFAQNMLGALKNFQIDYEEYLSHFTGDIIAHQMGRAARHFVKTQKKVTHTLIEDFCDYLQEEGRYLPSREEVNDFIEDVYILRNDVERLQARWLRIEGRLFMPEKKR